MRGYSKLKIKNKFPYYIFIKNIDCSYILYFSLESNVILQVLTTSYITIYSIMKNWYTYLYSIYTYGLQSSLQSVDFNVLSILLIVYRKSTCNGRFVTNPFHAYFLINTKSIYFDIFWSFINFFRAFQRFQAFNVLDTKTRILKFLIKQELYIICTRNNLLLLYFNLIYFYL